jgi:carbon-monoxide dehydrogenase medium subunit
VEIGAGTRQIAVEKSDRIGRACRLLRKAMPHVGSTANRNRGTVCGSLAHADPSAELPAVAVALDARFLINGPRGERRVGASDFFVSELTTCVEPDEYLQSVTVPVDPPRSGSAFAEVGPRAHGFAIAGVAARVTLDGAGRCVEARLAGIGFGPCAVRIAPAERLLAGSVLSPEEMREAGNAATAYVEPGSDIHADAAYRKHLAGVLVVRALREAAAEARGMAEE